MLDMVSRCAATGVKNWFSFARLRYGSEEFPPSLNGLLEWSHTFRCVGTYSNYLGYVRTACLALDKPIVEAGHPALHRAKASVVKRMMFTSRCAATCVQDLFSLPSLRLRPRMFLQRSVTRNLVIAVERGLEEQRYAMLWLITYTFLLRLPSEALPVAREDLNSVVDGQAVFFLEDPGTVTLRLKRRKNKLHGSTLRRSCVCKADPRTCPVHTLWHKYFEPMEAGSQPWASISAGSARSHLRTTLKKLSVSFSLDVYHGASLCLKVSKRRNLWNS